ncbi:MAG: hypothetical protein KDG55_01120 [Rhodocyclaceae bacterium]|nr:hypothetical protein [Rhodocyclaceae bacterium]
MRPTLQRMRAELTDLVELVLLPGLAAVLPWTLCFRVFRYASRWRFLYRHECEAALAGAVRHGWAGDPVAWIRHHRLMRLIDHADLYLSRTRGDGWMDRHLQVEGTWPDAGAAAVLCTFHWGAGMWGLRHARSSGLSAHALIAPVPVEQFRARWVRLRYILARYDAVRRALGHSPLDVSASLRPALRALRGGEQVLAAIDVPADQVSASKEIEFLGLRARVPRGLLRVAAEQGVPVTVYLTGFRMQDGRRVLRIHRLPVCKDPDTLVEDVFVWLEQAIREEPSAWHFWAISERFLVERPRGTDAGSA